MAVISARCLRSLVKASSNISRTAVSTNGLVKSRTLSSLVLKATPVFKDSGLLQKIARDSMAKNLAKRHSRLSTAINQLMLVVAVDLNGQGGEGAGDELSVEICSDDDEQLRI
ncbi:uncharacterized protein LOC116294371 isoform X2 [Actinia tenebrosa]|uniref:Uncharacterized protein LOC116294371 isoform X2 n=1 Tax=Actinia tenebrosa TaxID=6105 RepID=A0A6P8HQJ3_ACTTE|nr:uncharacterized protein LOC116294371 isoform X2 [Actinia tenebrosa]